MSLLPPSETPSVTHRDQLSTRDLTALDALLVVVPEDCDDKVFAQLPDSERWRGLHSREKPRSGTVRSTSLTNSHQTLAVLGYQGKNDNAFERLTLAGKMLKEASARQPQSLALAAPGMREKAVFSLEALLSAALAQAFSMPAFQSKKESERRIKQILLIDGKQLDLNHIKASARANNIVRWLTALPPNKLDARAYRRLISELARNNHVSMRWLDEAALKRLGCNAFLAVAAGNAERTAGIAHLKYRPPRRPSSSKPDIALIGKGVLFDTGGTNLKPHRAMLDMHTDMSGSAVALATLLALAELRAPIAADAWLAITENRPGPKAYVPQDVVRAANGVTIQVIHTDAEGRMALADTLALAGRTEPRLMIDFATLTGACVYALTERMSGVLSNREELLPLLVEAGRTSGERVWGFPCDKDFDSDLESKIADVMQCSVESKGDHILATRFLSRFVPENVPWIHVDLASSVRTGGLGHINTDVTGFGPRFALELILRNKVLSRLEQTT